LVASALVILPALPLLASLRANSGTTPSFAVPAWYGSLAATASEFLGSSLVALVGIGCLYIACQAFGPATPIENQRRTVVSSSFFVLEAALMLGLVCLPLLVLLVSKCVTHILFPRYGIAFVVGVSALLATAAWVAFAGRRVPALLIAIGLATLSAGTALSNLRAALQNRAYPIRLQMQNRIPASLRHDDWPIVAGYANPFMELNYYGDPDVLKRLVYVSSERLASQLIECTNAERMMIGPAPFFRTHVMDYSTFVKAHPVFYVLGPSDWILRKLVEGGSNIQLIQDGSGDAWGNGADLIFLVHYKHE
jgi:hypothetical protein